MESRDGGKSLAAPWKVERHESAGGVVLRPDGDAVEVVLCGRKDPRLWALPKGTPDQGESREETALREVREETGLSVEALGYIGNISYWFVKSSERVRCHKTVHYFLMNATGGDTAHHDHEFDEVGWFSVGDALAAMTYGNEVEIVEKGLSMAPEKG